MYHTVKEEWKKIFSSLQMTLVLIVAFIFYVLYIFISNYDFRFRNAIILLGEVIVFLCILHICIFVCMQASLCDLFPWFMGLF